MPIYYLKIQVGLPHPDPVVETASLASVESADVWLVQFSCHLWYPIFDDAANVLNHYEFRPSRCLGNSSNNPERNIRHVADYLMVRYTLSLPPDVINERKLSALQLESIVYARYLCFGFGWKWSEEQNLLTSSFSANSMSRSCQMGTGLVSSLVGSLYCWLEWNLPFCLARWWSWCRQG